MKIRVTARHFELSGTSKDHVNEAIEGLERFYERIIDGRVVLTKEKGRWRAELILFVPGATLTSESEENLLFRAVDESVGKMGRQLKKHKAKVRHDKDMRDAKQHSSAVAGADRSG
jgi:putative sigma-54 modulation protein